MKHRRALTAAALFALALPTTLSAQEAKPKPEAEKKEPEKKDPPKTDHVAKAGPFEIVAEVDALFTADREHQINIVPKAWAEWAVVSAVPHGSRVKKGDRLITLDSEKLEKAIEEAELTEPAARLALKLAESEFAAMAKATPMQLEAARRAKRTADEDWAHYEKVGHAEALKAAERSVEFAELSFEYSKEELEQLEKMYKADDLTEETEEIILKRARNSFERAKENLRLSKMNAEREIKVNIPRNRIAQKAAVETGELGYQTSVQNLPRLLDQKRHALAKAKRERADAVQKLRDLKTDLAAMDLRAPADGVVYYGMSKDGNWATAAAIAKKLIPGGKLAPREVLMTIAENGATGLAAAVPEEKLAGLRAGLRATASPVSNPSLKIFAKVTEVSFIPGAFSASFRFEGEHGRLYPGMKAKVEIEVAKFDKAITVPNNLVDGDGVWVADGDEKKRRKVRTGPTDGKVTVILNGLKDGDKIVSK